MNYLGRNNIATDPQRGIFRVARQAFTSEQLLQIEREEIFDKCWIYVGHESEIPTPGAYVSRPVAGRELIFNRDTKGVVHAFLDACSHRGAKLSQERKGVAKNFQCIYHGWVFGANGAFRRQPHHDSYPPGFEADGAVDLRSVPRLESYRGFWFVCFDPDAISLHDYLAGAREYLDCVADQSEAIELISGSQEYVIRANWKLLCENSIDGYHADNLHATYFDYVRNVSPKPPPNAHLPPPRLEGVSRSLGNGHAVVEFTAPWGRPAGKWSPVWGEQTRAEMDAIYKALKSRLGEARAQRIAHQNRNLVIFPNLVVVDAAGLVIRTMFPKEPGVMQVSSWAAAPKGESEWLRKIRLRNFLEFLGPGGLATPDDIEALERCQQGYRNQKEAGWNDISKGALEAAELPMEDEGQIRTFWKQWAEYMDRSAARPAAQVATR